MDLFTFLRDLAYALFTELVSTVIAIPLVTYLVVRFLQNLKSARIWGVSTRLRQILQPRPFPTIVLSTSAVYEGPGQYQRPMTGIGQVRALTWFGGPLGTAYRSHIDNTRVVFSDDYPITRDEFTDDLIVIGGPKTNSIGRALLDNGYLDGVLPEDFSFSIGKIPAPDGSSYRTFVLEMGGTQWQPANDDEVIGLVLRCHNPLSSLDRNLTYVAGLGTFGTEAAARALIENRLLHDPPPLSWRWFRVKIWHNGKHAYLAIIGAKLSGDGSTRSVGATRILARRELAWAKSPLP